MGLDITHYKATLKQPDLLKRWNVVTEETYLGFDAPFEHFLRYIQPVVIPETHCLLVVPHNESDQEYTKQWFLNFSTPTDVRNAVDDGHLEAFIESYIRENSFENMLIERTEGHKWWVIAFNRPLQRTGFYVEEVGYQRKGMNDAFWTRFCTNDNVFHFTKQEDFEFALSCVDFYWDSDTQEDLEQRRILFKADFVDKFEYGASYMAASY
jgi:hypothetical protein